MKNKTWKTLFIFMAIICLGCQDVLEVPDITQEQVLLLAPMDSTIVKDSVVNLTWNGVLDADAYLVQIATPNFENAAQIVLDSIIVLDSTFVGTKVSKALQNMNYEWRVKAMNSSFETSFSTALFSVETPSN